MDSGKSCPGCGSVLPEEDGEIPRGIRASAACARVFAEVGEFALSHPPLAGFHQLAIDAYTAQHATGDGPRLLHALVGLYLAIEHGRTASEVQGAQHRLGRPFAPPLVRPSVRADMAITDVAERGLLLDSLRGHVEALYEWADSVWATWEPHHVDVAAITRQHLPGFLPVPQRNCFGFHL
ncbi:DUF5946 family protein [Nocardia sp. NPDC055321]